MDKVCGIQGCMKIPELYCECKTNNYYCPKHSISHLKQMGKLHYLIPLFISIEGELKENTLKGITLKHAFLVKTKLKMKKRCSDIIELTIQAYRNATKKIKDDQRYYNCIRKMIIETSEMDKEAYESGLFLSDSVHDLQYNIESLRKDINSCFN